MTLKKRQKFQTSNKPNDWLVKQEQAGRRVDIANDAFSPAPADSPCAPETALYRVVSPPSASLIETFTRTTTAGWGTSEICGLEWDGTTNSTNIVNGSEGVVDSGGSQVLHTTTAWTIPIEILVKLRFASGLSFLNDIEFQVIGGVGGTTQSALWAIDDGSSLTAFVDDTDLDGSGSAPSMNGGGSFWVRMKLTTTEISMAVWADGDTEPSPQLIDSGTLGSFPATPVDFQVQGGNAVIDSIEFVSGLTDCGCIDNFDRTESETWGTGDIGEWITLPLDTLPPDYFGPNLSVNGSKGILDLQQPDQESGWVYLNGSISEPPIELLTKFAVRINWDSTNIEWSLQMDGPPDPSASSDWLILFLDLVDATGSFSNHGFSLEFSLQSSSGADELSSGMFPVSGVVDEDYVRWDLWARLRIDESGNIYAKIWEDGDTEPGSWTMQDLSGGMAGTSLINVGHWLAPSSDGVAFTTFETDSFEIVEGCINSSSEYSIIDDETNTVGTIDSNGVINSEELDLTCPLHLVTDLGTDLTLPTDAQYVTDIWFDGLHATRTLHWEFEAPRTINVLSSLIDNTKISVAFVTEEAL